jgi:hypothetical protein
MSRTVRFVAALVILASLTCGSLAALPCGLRSIPAENAGSDFLTAAVEWLASILAREPSGGKAPVPEPQSKDGSHIDPIGGGH